MNVLAWLGLAALIVAIVAVPITIWAIRRWGNRRRRVLITYEFTPLFPNVPSEARNHLKVTYNDIAVDDPYLIRVRLQNIGPADIASDYFDARSHIVVKLNCKLYGLINATHPESTSSITADSNGSIELAPILLKRHESWIAEAIVSGIPTPVPIVPLIDTDILDKGSYDTEVGNSFFMRAVYAVGKATPGLAGSVVASLIDALPPRL